MGKVLKGIEALFGGGGGDQQAEIARQRELEQIAQQRQQQQLQEQNTAADKSLAGAKAPRGKRLLLSTESGGVGGASSLGGAA